MEDKTMIFLGLGGLVAVIALATKNNGGSGSGSIVRVDTPAPDVAGVIAAEAQAEASRLEAASAVGISMLQLFGVQSEHKRDVSIAQIEDAGSTTRLRIEDSGETTRTGINADRDIRVTSLEQGAAERIARLHEATQQAEYRSQLEMTRNQQRAQERAASADYRRELTKSVLPGAMNLAGDLLTLIPGGGVVKTVGKILGGIF